MADPRWRSDEGWPYRDSEGDVADPWAEPDWDVLSLHARAPHLFDHLDPLERQVVTARFGLGDGSPRSMKDLRRETGLDNDRLRTALGTGLAKLRAELSDDA
jgi:DNA-directed RNA polymerase sigma subunit (sigma70/sigma32)